MRTCDRRRMRPARAAPLLAGMLLAGLLGSAVGTGAQEAAPVPDPITATVDVTRTGPPINPLLYGYFIENLGSIFEGGLWAEKIGDRKFFHAVTHDSVLTPPNSRSRFVPRWWPLGPEGVVTMDSVRVWVGEHSPRIALDPDTPHGIRQPGIPVSEGRRYTGRVVLAADPGTRVRVSLVWDESADGRQTVTIEDPSTDYATYPLELIVGATNREGVLEITGTGSGSLLIGAVSLMRADNIEGFRPDMIEALRRVNPTMTRWGGNFSAGYEWRDGIGDRDRRPPRYDHAWDAVEQNDVGTFEVLALNRLLGAEPNIGVNSGLGDAYSAAQWVEYVNGGPETPMGRRRTEHGHPEPFGVEWWGIGNEMYGEWQLGHMAIDHYVLQHNRFAKAMRAVDPSIILVASGATPFETGTTERHHRRVRERPFAYGSRGDWSGQLLEHSWQYFDYLAEHIYAVTDAAFDAERQEFVPIEAPLQDRLRRIANRVQGAVEAWEHYQATMPWLEGSRIRMVLDEWAAGGWRTGDIAGALGAALVLHEMFRHTDVWAMSAYTALTSVLAYDRTDAYPTVRATGLLFELYTEHLGTVPVAVVDGSSPQPELPGTVGVDKPAESSGSPTYPLDVLAALSEDGETLTVAVANPSESPRTLRLDFRGATPRGGRVWTLSSPELGARAVPGGEPVSTVTEAAVPDAGAPLTVPAAAIQLYELRLE